MGPMNEIRSIILEDAIASLMASLLESLTNRGFTRVEAIEIISRMDMSPKGR